MINCYIPSKDRPAQCDLLLRSLRENAPFLQPTVVYAFSNCSFEAGYDKLIEKHPEVTFIYERNAEDSENLFYRFLEENTNDLVCLFADDCIFFRHTNVDEDYLRSLFQYENLWTFTYRLGRNITVRDYTTNRSAKFPDSYAYNDYHLMWDWRSMDFWDMFGFAVGFDGYVYRAQDLLTLSERSSFGRICFWEGMICCKFNNAPPEQKMMTCPTQSTVFVQQINTTHDFAYHTTGKFNISCKQLNDEWLQGKEIDLLSMDFSQVNCTHGEIPFNTVLAEK